MKAVHWNFGALGTEPLVRSDLDRSTLLRAIVRGARAAAATVVAYCIMTTHAHLVTLGELAPVRRALAHALQGYARWFNRRYEREGRLFRGRPMAVEIADAEQLARAIQYVHENPLKAKPPLCARVVEFPWASARAYAGLDFSGLADVEKGLEAVRPFAWRIDRGGPELADLQRVRRFEIRPDLHLAAAAQVHGLAPAELVAARGRASHVEACALYAVLGIFDGFEQRDLAEALDVSRERITQLSNLPVPAQHLRVARTLVRLPEFRRMLKAS